MIDSTFIWFLFIWSINSAGLFFIAASMSKHQKQIFGHELKPLHTRIFKIAGWVLLILTLVLCTTQGHWSTYISYWIGTLTFAALFSGLCLSYYPQFCKKIGLFTLLLANACLISALF